jgi:predicted nucleic acid-binding protein
MQMAIIAIIANLEFLEILEYYSYKKVVADRVQIMFSLGLHFYESGYIYVCHTSAGDLMNSLAAHIMLRDSLAQIR